MEIILSESKSLSPTCKADDAWLHSPYDPAKEASRFVAGSLGDSRPSHVLLLGPCLDYITPAIRSILPGAKIVSVQYDPFFEGAARSDPDASWSPASPLSIDAFVDAALDEDAISGVAVLEWEPASRAFPEAASLARRAVKSSLDRLNSSFATVKAFGKRWIANACASFLLVERIAAPAPTDRPVLVAASGPSLGDSLELLARHRGGFITIAVSSALAACAHRGIMPDIVVATDGGFWSRHHLYALSSSAKPTLAAPLTALPSSSLYRGAPIAVLDQGSFAESELASFLGSSIRVPPHGTVSGTALQLAARLTEGPIIAAGLDLAAFGDHSHASPHGFDPVLAGTSSRLAPTEGIIWSRGLEESPEDLAEKPWRSSRSLRAYASALGMDARRLAGRIYRLNPSPQAIANFEPIDGDRLAVVLRGARGSARPLFELSDAAPLRAREARLSSCLGRWREQASSAAIGLGAGIIPESGMVAELLRSIDIVDYAAARRAALSGGDPAPAARDLAERCSAFFAGLERRFAP